MTPEREAEIRAWSVKTPAEDDLLGALDACRTALRFSRQFAKTREAERDALRDSHERLVGAARALVQIGNRGIGYGWPEDEQAWREAVEALPPEAHP